MIGSITPDLPPARRWVTWAAMVAIGALAIPSVAGPAQAQDQAAPTDLSMGSLIGEGNAIAQQQHDATTSLQKVSDDETQAAKLKTGLDQDSQSLNAQAQDFNARCNHPFVTGQENQVAACQAEQQKDRPAYEAFAERQTAYKAKMDEIQKRRQAAELLQAQLAVKAETWRHKMNALAVTAQMQACVSAAAPAPAGATANDTAPIVAAYQRCWDQAK